MPWWLMDCMFIYVYMTPTPDNAMVENTKRHKTNVQNIWPQTKTDTHKHS